MINNLYLIDDDYRYIESISLCCKYAINKHIYKGYAVYTWADGKYFHSVVRDTLFYQMGYYSGKDALQGAFLYIDSGRHGKF